MTTAPESLAGLIRRVARERPEHPYLHFEGTTYTYAELDLRSSQIASALAGDGVTIGDRVALLDKNHPSCLELMFAAAKCGAVFVPINWRLSPVEVLAVLADAKPKVVVAGVEFADVFADGELPDGMRCYVDGEAIGRLPSLADWVAGHHAVDPDTVVGAEMVALQMYTSGTTGLPKGVMLTGENLLGRHEESARIWGYDENSVSLVVSPLFHIGGLGTALLSIVTGSTTVLLRIADPAAILRAVDEYRITNGLLVPAIIGALLQTPGCESTNWSTFRTMMYGASPISETLLRRAMAVMKCAFIQLYGITEHSGCITYLAPEDHDPERRPGLLRSCGRPLPWVEVQVVDPDTLAPVDTGAVGEIVVRSTQVMRGYWGQPETTAEVISDDGWFHTGDAGYLDHDGYLYLHDRIKDMIVSGGENIFPAEIENVIASHPAVADATVIGIPDERWGEAPHAIVVLAAGHELDDDLELAIIASCREQLARYKCPRSIEAVAELPRNPAGKVLKRELRERAWASHDRRVA